MQRRDLIVWRGSAGADVPPPCRACRNQATRRDVLALGALLGSGLTFGVPRALAEPADERPQAGDQLVAIGAAEPRRSVDLASNDGR